MVQTPCDGGVEAAGRAHGLVADVDHQGTAGAEGALAHAALPAHLRKQRAVGIAHIARHRDRLVKYAVHRGVAVDLVGETDLRHLHILQAEYLQQLFIPLQLADVEQLRA